MTVCEKCGATRDYIPEACPSCHFQPGTPRELAIAALLTEEFGEENGVFFGTPRADLERIAAGIRGGHPPVLDEVAIQRHEAVVEAFMSEKPNLPRLLLVLILVPALLVVLWLFFRFT